MTLKHRDSGNEGPSYIIGFGEWQGGELVVWDSRSKPTIHPVYANAFYFMIELFCYLESASLFYFLINMRFLLFVHEGAKPLRSLQRQRAVARDGGFSGAARPRSPPRAHDGSLLQRRARRQMAWWAKLGESAREGSQGCALEKQGNPRNALRKAARRKSSLGAARTR